MTLAFAFAAVLIFAAGAVVGSGFQNYFWRRLCDELRLDRNVWRDLATQLTKQMVALKRKGYELQNPGRIRQAPDAEAEALRGVEQRFIARARSADSEFISAAEQDLIDQGLSPAAAKKEAARLRGEVTDMQPS